jgi:RNA polymerase sigma factor FliA
MNAAAREQLVNEHLHLPAVIATACRAELGVAGVISLDDMVAYGHRGLLEAAERYSPEVGAKFVTYSWHRIRGAVIDGVRENGPYGRSQIAARRALETEADSATLLSSTPANDNGRAEALLVRSDVPVDEIATGEDPQPEAAVDVARLRGAVAKAVAALPPRQRQIIELHYFQGHSFTDLSRQIGLTREYVARLHTRALRHLEGVLAADVHAHDGAEACR